jgi:hypothetical protein
MMVLATILLCVTSQQLDDVKEKLFTQWTTSSSIPNVTFGLPNENEISAVEKQIEIFRQDTQSSTAGELTHTQRQIDVPFLLGMVDGIRMEFDSSFAQKCVDHLSVFGDELGGIAASRLWRMRHRASVILGDEKSANRARDEFWSLQYRHPVDVAVFKLFDIEQEFKAGNVELARDIYDKQALEYVSKNTQFLRIPFAHAYARLATTPLEAVHGWFALAEWLVDYGYDQSVVDKQLVRWISRLNTPIAIGKENEDPRIASLATRLEITSALSNNIEIALEQLMVLARAGDGRAAERVLEQGDSKYEEEALSLLFTYPERVRASLDYWQLYAARIDYKNHELEQALERLIPISNTNGEYKTQALDFIEIISGSEFTKLEHAFGTTSDDELPEELLEQYPPQVIQDLLTQCIHLCHSENITKWNAAALAVLLKHSRDVDPSVLAEGHRLLGNCDKAIPLFRKAIERNGDTVQTTAGLADCMGDRVSMGRVVSSTSFDGASSYWFWLSNLRLLQWYIDDGGNATEVVAKVNRLRKKDASLGGELFLSEFNSVLY